MLPAHRRVVRKELRLIGAVEVATRRGTIRVSTPEATALDLVGYQYHAGGLSEVTTVLAELAEKDQRRKLAAAAAPVPRVQRLGYLPPLAGADVQARSVDISN